MGQLYNNPNSAYNQPAMRFHHRVYLPSWLERLVKPMRGRKLDFGPHATERFKHWFGAEPGIIQVPKFQVIEVYLDQYYQVSKTVVRFHFDQFTDITISVNPNNMFVISCWRVPRWFDNPAISGKYMTREKWERINPCDYTHLKELSNELSGKTFPDH